MWDKNTSVTVCAKNAGGGAAICANRGGIFAGHYGICEQVSPGCLVYSATSQRSPLNSYHTFLKELLQRAFFYSPHK